jgi:hypothetical protein
MRISKNAIKTAGKRYKNARTRKGAAMAAPFCLNHCRLLGVVFDTMKIWGAIF